MQQHQHAPISALPDAKWATTLATLGKSCSIGTEPDRIKIYTNFSFNSSNLSVTCTTLTLISFQAWTGQGGAKYPCTKALELG